MKYLYTFGPSLLFLFTLLFSTGLHGQRRSDLLAEIDTLNARIRDLEEAVNQAQRRESASKAEAASYEVQVRELKDANNTLLKNLNSFAQVSNKNNESLNQALASLEAREAELRGIMETLGRNDSTIIALLTDAKKTLGPDAQLKAAGGSLVISGTLDQLFGGDTNTELTEGAAGWLAGIATLVKAHPQLGVTVEGLSMTGDIALAARQGTAVMNALRDNHGIAASRMSARGRDGNFSEGVDVMLHPDYRAFYRDVKAEIKQ
ncbi:hypothetical protein [Robiginitalea sediminis]|uniref:hypothetical protein n=1 Tax=Robiginitalea sediminis TaxID=1982593 RepID=UPI00117BCD24|nr:hypothetical protein [Robiginitalea sediminis]